MAKSKLVIDAQNGFVTRVFSSGIRHSPVGNMRDNGYLQLMIGRKCIKLHRLIYEHVHGQIPDGLEVDHINGVRTDNRIENLRLVNRGENQQNRHRPNRNNKLGIKGVAYNKKTNKFKSQIVVGGKKIHLGYFQTIEQAVSAYNKAAFIYHTHNPSSDFGGEM